MGIGIWIIVDRNFMSAILGTDLMTAAAFLIIVGGAIVTVISLLGCMGAFLENKILLLIVSVYVQIENIDGGVDDGIVPLCYCIIVQTPSQFTIV